MSKRCCAKTCFNSQLKTRFVQYFGFPKNEFYSHMWARAAGREDLLEKPLNNIIKYYLCSTHFEDDCFVDETKTTLKKELKPFKVPLPTKFESNFQQFLPQTDEPKREKSEVLIISKNPSEDTRIEYISPLTVNYEDNDNSKLEIDENVLTDDQSDPEYMIDEIEHHYENNNDTEIDEELLLDDGLVIVSTNDDTLGVESPNNTVCANNFLICRLCGNAYPSDYIISFHEINQSFELIAKFLPHLSITLDDNHPQQTCKFCLDKVEQCCKIMVSIETVQEKYFRVD